MKIFYSSLSDLGKGTVQSVIIINWDFKCKTWILFLIVQGKLLWYISYNVQYTCRLWVIHVSLLSLKGDRKYLYSFYLDCIKWFKVHVPIAISKCKKHLKTFRVNNQGQFLKMGINSAAWKSYTLKTYSQYM